MYTVFCTIAAVYGFGQHSALLSSDQFIAANKNEIIGQTAPSIPSPLLPISVFFERALYMIISETDFHVLGQTFCIIGIAASKAGVAAFQLRIVEKTWQKALLIVTTIAVSGVCVICALFDFIRCSPVEAVWNPLITDAVCWVSTASFTDLSVSLSGTYS